MPKSINAALSTVAVLALLLSIGAAAETPLAGRSQDLLNGCEVRHFSPAGPPPENVQGRVFLGVERSTKGRVRVLEVLASEPGKTFRQLATQFIKNLHCPAISSSARGKVSITYSMSSKTPVAHFADADATLEMIIERKTGLP